MLCFVFGGWDVADLAVDAEVDEPVDVLGDGDLEIVDVPPWPPAWERCQIAMFNASSARSVYRFLDSCHPTTIRE
ncbi:hypothetical protein A6035_01075 [Dietzia lutea]|uniref:Uncharacterized protein n=1 Tax=Dietzia lutea TaxID=546160 RepID=A0A2S1R425_9ACTN|nr:hypothetical protein A6035_01075 [Dietzia lutea]